jgi:hypothetical protein
VSSRNRATYIEVNLVAIHEVLVLKSDGRT